MAVGEGGSESGVQAEGVLVELTHKLGAGRLGTRAAGSVFGEKAFEKDGFLVDGELTNLGAFLSVRPKTKFFSASRETNHS